MKPYYTDEWVTIYHGDCSELLYELSDNSVDLVLTDPPFFNPATHYISRDEEKGRRTFGDMSIMKMAFKGIYAELARLQKAQGHTLMFCDCVTYPTFFECAYNYYQYVRALIWYKGKNYFSLGKGAWRYSYEMVLHAFNKNQFYVQLNRQDLIECKNVRQNDKLHQAEKPTDLLQEMISAVTNEGFTVLDPFLGSGSTLLAAKKLNRRCIGIEIEERYCEISAKRCSQGVFELV